MADLDDDSVVVTLPADGDAQVTKLTTDDPVNDLKNQFATLKSTLESTTQRLATSEATAQQATRQLGERTAELAQTRKAVADSQLDTVLSGIQAAEAEGAAAERDYVAASEAGDFAAQARAQRKMAAAESKKIRLEEAKADLEESKTREPAVVRTEQRAAFVDAVERFTQGMSPKSAAWIRAHPECVTDSKKNARMLAAHNLAVADDIEVDSPEYFQRIEAGINPVAKETTQQRTETVNGRRPSSAAAPATGAGGGMNGGGVEVRLTAREVAAATDGTHVWNVDAKDGRYKKGDPIGVSEFARRKSIMMKEGHYDKSYTEN